MSVRLPLANGSYWSPTEADLRRWQFSYPDVCVEDELGAMSEWLATHPDRRYSVKQIRRFVERWLTRDSDKVLRVDPIYDDWKSLYLNRYFEYVTPMSFYRDVFGDGFLQESGSENYGDGKTVAIAVELVAGRSKKKLRKSKRYTICDDLDQLDELLFKKNFIILSPISYIGKSRSSSNARYLHALAIDVDGISTEKQLKDLLYQLDGNGKSDLVPRPTYIVNSGNGLHYYYVFEKPIPLFENTAKELQVYKDRLTRIIWNRYVTDLYEKVQIESLFQGFRLAGGVTKSGRNTVIFKTGAKVNIEYLNGFVAKKYQVKHSTYFKELPLAKAKELYPDWYQRRVVEKQPKGHWQTKDKVNGEDPYALYHWWLRRIREEKTVGHRYFCIMCLAVYAKKTGVDYETLERDAMDLVEVFDSITEDESNHFLEEDVLEALEMYNDNYYTFPINTIRQISDISIEKNKRNGRKQDAHMRYMSSQREFKLKEGECTPGGRPTAYKTVLNYLEDHPTATQYQVKKDTGLDKKTVRKWYNAILHGVEPQKTNKIKYKIGDMVEFTFRDLGDAAGKIVAIDKYNPDDTHHTYDIKIFSSSNPEALVINSVMYNIPEKSILGRWLDE